MDIDFENKMFQMFDTGFLISPRGDRLTTDEIDILERFPDVSSVQITGLDQQGFEHFIGKYGKQLRVINFFKNKLVQDWSALGELTKLERISWFHNQRIEKLWDMSQNTSLELIDLSDFTRLKDLSGIEKAPALEWFRIGDAIWDKTVIRSLECFRGTGVRRLDFSGKDIEDKDMSFLSEMPRLEIFNFPANLFTTEQIAWIDGNYPHIIGTAIAPYITYGLYEERICVTGKRKPSFELEGNEKRLKKCVDNYTKLVEKYKGEPFPM